jgi:hypothetical protein
MYQVAERTLLGHVRLIQESGLAVIGLEALREQLASPKRSGGTG